MSPNISASKSPLRNCVRSSRDGQFSSQPNTTERGTASLRYPIIKQQQATNAEMIINLKTAKMLSITLKRRPLLGRAGSCVILALLAFCVPGSSAQGSASKLRVATRVVPPMVIEDKGALRGFSIELWNSISARLNRETEYLVMSDVGDLLDAVGDGRADLGIAAISITSERESRFDFSQPILNAGLQILVRGAAENAEPSPVHLMRLFFSRTLLIWLGIALLLIMIPAHLVWVVERHHRNGIVPSKNYFPGIFHAMFWAAGTLATQADHMPRHWMARIVAVLWMFTAAGVVDCFYSAATPSPTLPQNKRDDK